MPGLSFARPDITLHLDRKGVIRDVVLSDHMPDADVQALVGQPWAATVADVGGSKVRSMLEQALNEGVSAFRQINQRFPGGAEHPIEFATVRLGEKAGIIAIGKSLQTVADVQSKLVAAQQAIERDYWKFREIETRYRMLFDTSAEAVVVVHGTSLAVIEANPAAIRALGAAPVNGDFLAMLPAPDRGAVRAMLERARDQGRAPGVLVHLGDAAVPWMLRASPMSGASMPAFMLQLSPVGNAEALWTQERAVDVEAIVDGLPDGIAAIDGDGVVLRTNQAFLDLIQVGSAKQVLGERIGRWLGRPGADLTVLLANVNHHGLIRLFATTLHGEFGAETEVEISAAGWSEGGRRHYVLLMRDVGTRLSAPQSSRSPAFISSAATRPIGSAPLRELVSETVGAIEQHYIESALDLSGGNRKAAAALLGLSRQGLYAKLRRYGLDRSDPAGGNKRS